MLTTLCHFWFSPLRIDHNYDDAFYENNRVDAVAMERLTSSKFIMDMYAFCGMTVVTDFAGREVSDVAKLMNPTDRLDLAIKVAQGIADIHSINDRPSLVHNDINLANLVITQDNRPVLNDFNIAVLLMKHNETGETCPFVQHFPNPQWRAPEEQVLDEAYPPTNITEKADIYALGNVLYRLTVGNSPWKRPGAVRLEADEKEIVARLKFHNGSMPNIPEEVRASKDPATQAMLQAMYSAYRFNPAKRPSAAQIVKYLQNSLDAIRKNQTDRYIRQ